MIKQLITAGVIASSLGLGFSAQAAPLNENLCGGSPNGLWQLLGVGMDGVLKAENPDSSVTYQTSSGGFANIIQMQGDTCDLAIVHAGEAMKAISGEPPFPKAVNNFRAIGVLYNWAPMQWVMTQDFSDKYGIHSLQDIADKKPPLRLVLNRKGILPSMVGESSLKALGVTRTTSSPGEAAWSTRAQRSPPSWSRTVAPTCGPTRPSSAAARSVAWRKIAQ